MERRKGKKKEKKKKKRALMAVNYRSGSEIWWGEKGIFKIVIKKTKFFFIINYMYNLLFCFDYYYCLSSVLFCRV